jgi:hypothetical protein
MIRDVTSDDERRTPIDQALDLFVYLPVGFLFELPRCVPRFIERGRQELHSSARATDLGGRLAPVYRLDRLQAHAEGTLRALGMIPGETEAGADAGGTGPGGAPHPVAATTPETQAAPAPASDGRGAPAAVAAAGPAAPEVTAAELAIPGYDSLSASQVMPRLESLSEPELELVRRYENAHRGRRTILNKIVQLQSR